MVVITTVWYLAQFPVFKATARWFTLLSYLDLSAAEVGLFDVFDAEVAVALGVFLLFVTRRCLVIRAVRV